MKKRKITTAAFLAGVTTLAVSLPAMAEQSVDTEAMPTDQRLEVDYINGEDFRWIIDEKSAS